MPNGSGQDLSCSSTAAAVDERDRSSVRSLLRALDLLELLAETSDGLRLVDVASRADMAVSTVHRLLGTLEERRFVFMDKETRRWRVGAKCLSVGAAFGRNRNFTAAAMQIMQRLRARSGLTINLALAESRHLTLVSQLPSSYPPVGLVRLGSQSDIAATALGQSILAALPQRQLAAWLDETPVLHDRLPLSDTIRETQARRYALDDEVNVVGLRCVAAPIFDENSVPIGAISVVGMASGRAELRLGEIGDIVLQAAAEVTDAIGGYLPVATASGALGA